MKQDKINDDAQNSQSAQDHKNKHAKSHGKVEKQVEDLKNQLGDTEARLTEIQDKYLRLSAEFDNYRKRTLKEKMELIKTAGEDCLIRIIPVMDDFDRALQLIDISKELDPVKEGIHLIYNKFKEVLNQQGVKEIDALNQEFNTDVHEAITKVTAPDENSKGKVLDVVQKGYYLNEKVIRFAKVIVGE